jgi:oxygen-independent coproporphyrinogen-3 oxidase
VTGPLGLYVHIPFCEVKCTYCHFAIDPGRPEAAREERYVGALLREIVRAPQSSADTLYLGGGTPSLLSLEGLGRLLSEIRSVFRLPPSAELTLEANPRDLDLQGYRAIRDLGVNRVSLGVQSFDDDVLKAMGRLHTAADARTAVAEAQKAGLASLSVDLILGWPGESRSRWQKNLEDLLALGPDHVSLYVLEVEGKTLLSHRAQRGSLRLPEGDLVADLYTETAEVLDHAGIERYEISNFARPGHESRHNGKYWDDQPFLGFGLSAHSYLPPRRSWNVKTFGAYVRRIEAGESPSEGERTLTPEERLGEAVFTGLRRREGIPLEDFSARYGVDPLKAYALGLEAAFEAELVEVDRGRLRLTMPKGVLLSNEVFRAFV